MEEKKKRHECHQSKDGLLVNSHGEQKQGKERKRWKEGWAETGCGEQERKERNLKKGARR